MSLTRVGDGLWLADGPPITAMMGFRYPTRMAVARLAGGDLWVWSPVALSDALREAVAELGPVRWLVAPNRLHHMALGDWMAAFPEAAAHPAPGLRSKRVDIAFAADLGSAAPPDWAGEIEQAVIPNAVADEVVFFHKASGTVLFCDLLQGMDRDWFTGWRRLVARLDLMTEAEPTVPRKFRLATRDRPAARAAMATVRGWPATRLVAAHAPVVDGDVAGCLARAFRWLDG